MLLIIFIQCQFHSLLAQRMQVAASFSPLALVDDLRFPLLQAGFETPINRNWSCFTELGIKYRKSFMDEVDSVLLPSKGFRVKLELRRYSTVEGKKDKRSYWAAGVEIQQEQHNTSIQYYKMPDTITRRGDDFGVAQSGWTFHLAYGILQKRSNHFYTDLYAGIGLRYRYTENTGVEYLPGYDRLIRSVDPSFADARAKADLATGGSWRPRVLAGIRIQWR